MSIRNATTPASYLILRDGDKVLLFRRKGTTYYNGWYSVPAGHVEEGEVPVDALIREIREEIGIELERDSIQHLHTMYRVKHDPTGNRADYFFTASKWKGEIQICEPEKCDALKWFSLDELPKKMMHHVHDAIQAIDRGDRYSELTMGDVVLNPTGQK